MKKVILFFSLVTLTTTLFAQSKGTTSAIIRFDASTSLDNMPKAENKTVIAELDLKTGDIAFEAAVKNFSFSNPSMQQHFNGNNWLNSESFPLFTYTGKITDLSKVNFAKNGTYNIPVEGKLTIKDITKPISADGTIVVNNGVLTASANFSIKLSEFGITNVSIDAGKVNNEPKISVIAEFK